MNTDDIKRIENELKEFHHLIEPSRKIIPDKNYYCNFGFKDGITEKVIIFDPDVLDFLEEDGALFSLLHEEGHFVHPPKHKWRTLIKIGIVLVLLAVLALISFSHFRNSFVEIISTSVEIFMILVIIFVILHYIDLRYFYQAYWADEFSADEYAIRGLMIIKPDVIPLLAMRSSFESLDECKKYRKRACWSQKWDWFNRKLKLLTHPTDEMRIEKAEELFKSSKNFSAYTKYQ
jgi:Zn-dependent protease with chaperone function